mmetsp:Transcript_56245/g.100175  ORF Transcript_56245/g.100175 Transcript_56245/m.100175 type:complete len:261 (-) Transcript_56245:476-1258(-)
MSRPMSRPMTANRAATPGLHKESLTYNPNRVYRTDAAKPPAGDQIRLTPFETVHGRKKVDLSMSDPSPANVRRLQEVAARRRESSRQGTPACGLPVVPAATISPTEMKSLETLENFYAEEGDEDPMAPSGSAFLTQVVDKPIQKGSDPSQRKSLPPVVLDHPEYSSTMTLLQLTRKDVEEHAKDISTISSILTLPGSIELKRTIAKMFADPKNAEEISKAELERKERKYQEDRNRQLQKQAEQLKKEREILKQELENLKT